MFKIVARLFYQLVLASYSIWKLPHLAEIVERLIMDALSLGPQALHLLLCWGDGRRAVGVI